FVGSENVIHDNNHECTSAAILYLPFLLFLRAYIATLIFEILRLQFSNHI
ncbi:hypothetical protein ACJX0J_028651, partial [Zea mays]